MVAELMGKYSSGLQLQDANKTNDDRTITEIPIFIAANYLNELNEYLGNFQLQDRPEFDWYLNTILTKSNQMSLIKCPTRSRLQIFFKFKCFIFIVKSDEGNKLNRKPGRCVRYMTSLVSGKAFIDISSATNVNNTISAF